MTGSLPMEDALVVARLFAVLALASWAARPLALRLVPGGSGWIAALVLAYIVMGWVPWALAALHIVPFGIASLAGLAALIGARLWLGAAPSDNRSALTVAVGFGALFWLGLAQRMGHADLSGLEKFTDMAFLAAAMRTDYMPPPDAWYAGEAINYYYVGQAMAAAWGNILGTTADRAYQIAMASIFALTGVSVWKLTVSLAQPAGPRLARGLGALAALLVLYGGNFHSALYTLFRGLVPATNPAFYFPDSTRFVGFDPLVEDKGFTEFPAYAFSVGDLHAHVAATPVFFLGLMILLAFLARGLKVQSPDLVQAAGFGWVLGLCAAINSWDVAILGLLALFAILAAALFDRKPTRARLDALGVACVVVAATGFLAAAPFLGHFEPFANGIEAAPNHTPLWQLLVLYGHGLLPLMLFGVVVWKRPDARDHWPIGLLFAGAVALFFIPEVVIVRDIYGLEYARANTMFKLSFRAQPLLIIAAVATLGLAVRFGRLGMIAAGLAALPVVSILAYMPHIFVWPSTIRSLDGLGFLGEERALVLAAGRLPLDPGQSFVEASGNAFGDTARVSAMTGQPTVIGWAAHEWLWRNNGDAPNRRAQRVETFYTTDDQALRCTLVRRYGVRYVILGQIERSHYEALNEAGLTALGPAVFSDAGGQILQVDPARCP